MEEILHQYGIYPVFICLRWCRLSSINSRISWPTIPPNTQTKRTTKTMAPSDVSPWSIGHRLVPSSVKLQATSNCAWSSLKEMVSLVRIQWTVIKNIQTDCWECWCFCCQTERCSHMFSRIFLMKHLKNTTKPVKSPSFQFNDSILPGPFGQEKPPLKPADSSPLKIRPAPRWT